jgi:hypothetical protein
VSYFNHAKVSAFAWFYCSMASKLSGPTLGVDVELAYYSMACMRCERAVQVGIDIRGISET